MVRARKGTSDGERATKRFLETMKGKYGDGLHDHFAEIGRKGGRNGSSGGFASKKVGVDGMTGSERASKYGTIGGRISKRGPAKKKKNDCDVGREEAQ